MTDSIHQYLDGECSADQLTLDERQRVRLLEAVQLAVIGRIRTRSTPDLTDRVMRRVHALESNGNVAALPAAAAGRPERLPGLMAARGRALAWLWSPRTIHFRLRPVLVLASLAGLLAFASLLPEEGDIAPRPVQAPPLYVQFRLEAPGASHVALAGSFTDWQARYELYQTAPGVWTVLVPLAPGVHDYTFVVDGEHWVPDPHAPQVPDHFGGANSRLTLLPPREAA